MLSAELIRGQGIDVLALFFETPFFTSPTARSSAKSINLPLKVLDISLRHLEIVKNPKHGFGANLNPCIDCHTLMFRIAGEMLQGEGASFVISGEVLGQRPFSQNKKALNLIAAECGLGGLLLRPLSAKHLPPTFPEKKGWVDRDRLMDFRGRSRKPQMELAKKLNIQEYPSPAGGCLLTGQVFSNRMRDLMESGGLFGLREIELLKLGRHFRLGAHTKLVVGRNKQENEKIRSLSANEDLLLTTSPSPGPTSLIVGDISETILELAVAITAAYSDVETAEIAQVWVTQQNCERSVMARAEDKIGFRKYMI